MSLVFSVLKWLAYFVVPILKSPYLTAIPNSLRIFASISSLELASAAVKITLPSLSR